MSAGASVYLSSIHRLDVNGLKKVFNYMCDLINCYIHVQYRNGTIFKVS